MGDTFDLLFPLTGGPIPLDHGYPLYAALSRELGPAVHGDGPGSADAGVFPVRGVGRGRELVLDKHSSLRLRVPAASIPEFVGLAGKFLDVGGGRVRLAPPTVQPLVPAAAVAARLVLLKLANQDEHGVTPDRFLAAARRQLDDLEIAGELAIPTYRGGERDGQPHRRVMRVKGAVRPGYPLLVAGLTADESIRLQTVGLGGRRKMGCGLFLPAGGTR